MSIPPDCALCRANTQLKTDVIAETEDGYLIRAITSPGNFLIIPNSHIESPQDLPDTWWRDVTKLLARVPGTLDAYNISLNIGHAAGQRLKHLHFWVIPRVAGQPASSKGLALLIHEANER